MNEQWADGALADEALAQDPGPGASAAAAVAVARLFAESSYPKAQL